MGDDDTEALLMRYRILLERLTLAALVLLMLLGLLVLVSFVAVETMNWVVFPSLGERLFALVLPALLAAIFALVLLNLALNQGILASQALAARSAAEAGADKGPTWLRLGLGLAALVAVCLGVLFLVNRANIGRKSRELEEEMQALTEANAPVLGRLASLVEAQQEPSEVVRLLAAIASTSPSFRDLELIVPQRTPAGTVYKRARRWSDRDDASLFCTSCTELLYSPDRFELEYLRRSTTDTRPQVFVRRPYLRVLQPLRGSRGKAVAYLHSTDHRYGHAEFK